MTEAVARPGEPPDVGRVEDHLKGIIDSLDGIVWEFDLATFCFTFVSRRAERLLGYPIPEWYRSGFWTDILHPDDKEWAVSFCMARTKAMEAHEFEYRVLHRDGRVLWVRDIVSVVVADGQPVHLRGIMVDITERKQTEKRLVLMDFALDHVGEVACLADRQGRILHVNEEASRLLGQDRTSLVGRQAQDLLLVDARDAWVALIAGLGTRGTRVLETTLRHSDGSGVPVEMTVSVFEHEGTPYVVALARDVRERQRLQREMQQLNQTLERRVAARTAEVEAVNRELESFAYTVSHDLRAPVRHLDGYIELLRKAIEPASTDQAHHYIDTIAEEAQRMAELIDGLLVFSRLGKGAVASTPVDLGALVRDVVNGCAPDIAGRDVRWRLGALPVVHGDPTMLRAAVANLVSNAVKFTRTRSPAEIEVGCEPRGGEIIFFIRDNGVGFDPAYTPKLFGVFERLHRVDEYEGHGIGLAHVRRIIARHGGRTWAEGALGKGATFYFSLPSASESA